eukprot:jgi/Picsp_1/6097/NSC_03451-R1_peptidyl-prolyl cis- cyclophilin type
MSHGNLVTVLLALCLAFQVTSALRAGGNFEDDYFLANGRSRSRIKSVARNLGDKTVQEEPEAKKIALLTPYGRIVVKLDKENAPEMLKLMLKKAKSAHKACSGCKFHRAEARPGSRDPAGGPPYGLIQGSLSTLKNARNIVKKEGTREVKSGDFVMIPGTYDFYIALTDHPEWGAAHTVLGQVEDFVVADLIGVQPYTTYKHPTQGTIMRMLKDKVPFIVTDDIEQLVMPRTALKNAATIRLGNNEVISGLTSKESDVAEDVFGQDDVDSKEEEFVNNGHDEFLDRDEELIDDEQDQESFEEEDEEDFVDEEFDQMRAPEMKRGQIVGSLNGNRGRNDQKIKAHTRVQDAFDENLDGEDELDEFGNGQDDFVDEEFDQTRAPEMKRGQIDAFDENLDGEDELDEFGNGQDDFVEEEDEFVDNDIAEQMAARYNRPPPTVRTRISHKATGSHSGKKSASHIHSKSYHMEEDLTDYNNEDEYDDGNERDGAALAFQHHNKAPVRKAITRDFQEDSDYQDTIKSRNHGKINGEKRTGSKGAKKSASGGHKPGKRGKGGTEHEGLPF